MNESNETEIAVVEHLAGHAIVLQQILSLLRDEWAPVRPPSYLVIAKYTEAIANGEIEKSAIAAILSDIEAYIASNGRAADIAAVGFLEALLGRASAGRFNFGSVVNQLGPKSLQFCIDWDQHTGCTTVADAK